MAPRPPRFSDRRAHQCLRGRGLVFGRRIEPSTKLHEGDRLEVAGALVCDPKKVRRARAESQGDVRVVTCGRHGGRRRLAKTAQ